MKRQLLSVVLLSSALLATPALAHDRDGGYDNPYSWGIHNNYHEDRDDRGDRDDWHSDWRRYDRHERHGDRYRERIRFDQRDEGLIIGWFSNRRSVDLFPIYLSGPAMQSIWVNYGRFNRPCALPMALARRLAPTPAGYERVMVGNDILLIHLRSGYIADVIHL